MLTVFLHSSHKKGKKKKRGGNKEEIYIKQCSFMVTTVTPLFHIHLDSYPDALRKKNFKRRRNCRDF